MAIEEVFPNPTVKQVAFEIRFPNLFYLESKIGELQVKIMELLTRFFPPIVACRDCEQKMR
jgi:hypothetical protein